jgi:HEPN domain-containing protein
MDAGLLRESASRQMRRALHAWCQGDHDMAALHGGIAFEHIVKAGLAMRHPSLLADARDFSTMLHAAGLGDQAGTPLAKVKTLGAAEAFKRLRSLIPVSITERDIDSLLTARNGVAHMGFHDSTQTAEALTQAVAVTDAVLADIGEGDIDFWGPYRDQRHDLAKLQRDALEEMRSQMLREAAEAAEWEKDPLRALMNSIKPALEQEREIAEKVLATKVRYAQKLYRICTRQRLYASDMKRLAKMAEIRKWSHPDECNQTNSRCPVCGYIDGVLRARVGEDGGEVADENVRECFAEMFDCPVCGLELDGGTEISAAGLKIHYYKDMDTGDTFRLPLYF